MKNLSHIVIIPKFSAKMINFEKKCLYLQGKRIKAGMNAEELLNIIRAGETSEILRLFQEYGIVYADEMVVNNTSVADLNKEKVVEYFKKIQPDLTDEDVNITRCVNANIIKDEKLTLGGLMFFAKAPQLFRSSFITKAVAFYGNSIAGSEYRDSEDITGTIPEQQEKSMAFFKRNLRHVQAGQNFNSVGILEVAEIALEEILQNAYTHRDYTKNAPVRIFIFDDRVEIISPGKLPNSLTIENIKMGNSVMRNNLIVTYASRLMKYRGIGSGILRALKAQPDMELINDSEGEQFIVKLPRSSYEGN